MDRSTAICRRKTVPCSAVPSLFDAAARSRMQYACETMHAILGKVIERYRLDPSFRALFPFGPHAEKLVIDSWSEKTSLPFVRYDVFFDERTGDFVFCELNADGSSGMNEDREIARAMRTTAVFDRFEKTHRMEANELVESLIDVFIERADLGAIDTPSVAICDYLESATLSEFEVYRQRFLRRGISCEICDVRNLVADNEGLRLPSGRHIDAVWRRCVAGDLLAHWNDSQPLIEAMRSGKTRVLGDFSGLIVHDKRIFHVLHLPQMQSILSEAERAFVAHHIPYTADLDGSSIDLERVKHEKNRWVVKPADGYGARNVHLGIDYDAKHWRMLVDTCANGAPARPFIAQRFQVPFRSPAIPLDESVNGKTKAESYARLLGLYAYGGRFAGVYSRLGPRNIVSGLFGGLTAATFWVDCDRPDPLELPATAAST